MIQQPVPAIVAQSAVQRLPRAALMVCCAVYVLAGFIARDPWKFTELASFGYMQALAEGRSSWWAPVLVGQPEPLGALLPYWLGAWAIQSLSPWLEPALATRLPFALLLTLTLAATWYGVYYLARGPAAQPVAFAFGGEAHPVDYARAVADGGLLALMACLGLAQLSHETAPALAQAAFAALSFCAFAALPYRRGFAGLALPAGLAGLALSGAPTVAVALGLLGLLACLRRDAASRVGTTLALVSTLLAAALATGLDLWRWRIDLPVTLAEWARVGRLLLWFTWPAWPLVLWTLWRWRRQGGAAHIALPLALLLPGLFSTLFTDSFDRALLMALPAMAALSAFALPTLGRSVASLIDWFTLLFFSFCAIVIWVFWFAMHTGWPAKGAERVGKLLVGFVPSFSLLALVLALLATLAWVALVAWRVGRQRKPIWKSVVLPAGGALLCWSLLNTLWLPPLDYARSYGAQVRQVARQLPATDCLATIGLDRAQLAAFHYHGMPRLAPETRLASCGWALASVHARASLAQRLPAAQWRMVGTVRRLNDRGDDMLLYRRRAARVAEAETEAPLTESEPASR